MPPFFLQKPASARRRVPLLVSVPHSGTEVPPEVAGRLLPRYVSSPEDTDWFVHELYGFVVELGATLLHARYGRYTIDLNRDPADRPLYSDSRRETTLVPTHSFAGEPLYRDPPGPDERRRRLKVYFEPYHRQIAVTAAELKEEFGAVLVYDAHSIKRLVPLISPTPFADVILGDQKGKTAAPSLTAAALEGLRRGPFRVAHNEPFQGGYITRHFGRPETGVHAIQLEMSQDVYMTGTKLDPPKADRMRAVLRQTLEGLIERVSRIGRGEKA